MYQIIGKDRRYGMVDSYGKFKSLREATKHMEDLKRSFGNIIFFKIVGEL